MDGVYLDNHNHWIPIQIWNCLWKSLDYLPLRTIVQLYWSVETMGDLYTPFRNYVKRMLTFQGKEKGTAKVLILDNDTVLFLLFLSVILQTQSISVAFSQTEILDYDGMYLLE